MYFKTLKFKNFKSYGDYETEISLEVDGLTLLHGNVGAGKTTFFDAILWGLYGECLSPIDELVNRITKSNTKVEIVFKIGQIEYSVIRYRNHDVHKNTLLFYKGTEKKSLKNSGDTQRLINEIIGIPYNAMVSTVIFSSELYVSFLRSKPSDRLKIIESVFSLKEVNLYQDYFKKKLSAESETYRTIETEVSVLEAAVREKTDNLENFKRRTKEKLISIKKSIEEKTEKIKILTEALKVSDSIDFNIEQELENLTKISQLVSENNKIRMLIESEKKRIIDSKSLANQIVNLKKRYDELKLVDVEYEISILNEHNEKTELVKQLKSLIEQEKSKVVKLDYLSSEINKEKEK